MVNPCQNRVRLGSQKKRVRLAAGTTLRGYDLTSIRANPLEMVDALSSLPALLSLIGTKRRRLSFLSSGCSVRCL